LLITLNQEFKLITTFRLFKKKFLDVELKFTVFKLKISSCKFFQKIIPKLKSKFFLLKTKYNLDQINFEF
jgi:hypothetical protein